MSAPNDELLTPGDPMFGRGDLADVLATDALLDRLAARRPAGTDLDGSLGAMLALLATDVDVEPAPLESTYRSLRAEGLWPPRQDGRPAGSGSDADVIELPGSWRPPRSREDDQDAGIPVGQSGTLVAFVPPGNRVGRRLVPALVGAGIAALLSIGAAAALTEGETLNPAKAVVDVVHEIARNEGLGEQDTRSPRATEAGGSGGDQGQRSENGADGSGLGPPVASDAASASASAPLPSPTGVGVSGSPTSAPTGSTNSSASAGESTSPSPATTSTDSSAQPSSTKTTSTRTKTATRTSTRTSTRTTPPASSATSSTATPGQSATADPPTPTGSPDNPPVQTTTEAPAGDQGNAAAGGTGRNEDRVAGGSLPAALDQ